MSILDNSVLTESNDNGGDYDDPSEYENFGECIMTIESFINSCKHNYFIDDDGYGEFLNEDQSKSGVFISPSEYRNIPEGYTHIAWYND